MTSKALDLAEDTLARLTALEGSLPVIGTWTPTYHFSTSGSVTYSVQYGNYIKFGRLVIAFFQIATVSTSSPVGNVSIAGLPFNISSFAPGKSTGAISRTFGFTNHPDALVALTSSVGRIGLYKRSTANGASSELLGSDLDATAGTKNHIDGVITFLADA